MRLYLQSIILTLFSLSVLSAQSSTSAVLTPQDTVFVQLDENNTLFYEHCIHAGQTLYSLSRLFRCTTEDILKRNALHPDSTLQIGQIIHIPVHSDLIDKSTYPPSSSSIPVVYQVKKSETLYRLSQVYFFQNIEQMIARNHLSDFTIQVDQLMIVGWITLQNTIIPRVNLDTTIVANARIIEELKKSDLLEKINFSVYKESTYQELQFQEIVLVETKDPSMIDSLNLENEIDPNLVAVNSRGIAIWEKNGTDKVNKFVMHRSAEINSLVEIRNPLTNRSSFARVVGHIPAKLHKEEIKLIMTPAVANELGIFDKRALVEMKYYITNPVSVN